MSPTRLSSWCLLGGILAGFMAAVWCGQAAARYSKPSGFQRFHQLISPDTLYYPPYAMLETLALARLQPGQTLVLVGGNSVLNGVSQPKDQVWTQHLQFLLGEKYVVVNLALRGAGAVQGAAAVAEALLRQGQPVVLVTNVRPFVGAGLAPGNGSSYGYLYWQALALQRLEDYPPREHAVENWLETLPPPEQLEQREMRLAGQLEGPLRFASLWHHIGYRHFFTVWNFIVRDHPWIARDRLADNEPPSGPVEQRFQNDLAGEVAEVRRASERLATRDPGGGWGLETASRTALEAGIETAFPPALRPRTLVILNQDCAYYRNQLSPDEQERDRAVTGACAQLWRNHGIACEVVGQDFDLVDYNDRVHFSVEGGRKLAVLVAADVRKLSAP